MDSTIEKWRKSNNLHKFLGLKGTVISFTKDEFYIALAKMENKSNLLLQIVSESNELGIGDKVKIVLRRVKKPNKSEVIEYGYKFKKIN
ncbi:MAG: hypothetical protein ABIJ05_05670 [Patescibacteria group bacterium]